MVSSHQPGISSERQETHTTVYPASRAGHRQAPHPGVLLRLTVEAYLT